MERSVVGPERGPQRCVRALDKRIMRQGALDVLRIVTGYTLHPEWMNMEGRGVRIHRGCKQGGPESRILWNLVLDEALGVRSRDPEAGDQQTALTGSNSSITWR